MVPLQLPGKSHSLVQCLYLHGRFSSKMIENRFGPGQHTLQHSVVKTSPVGKKREHGHMYHLIRSLDEVKVMKVARTCPQLSAF